MWKQFFNLESKFSVIFEDDGRVAYAYLLDDSEIVGDVWLYNRIPAPDVPEWKSDKEPPYLNAKMYVREPLPFQIPASEEDVRIEWMEYENDVSGARIYLVGRFAGELCVGSKPGTATAARKSGPLANVFAG